MSRLLYFGEWSFNPDTDELTNDTRSVTLEPRVARLLAYFLDHPGELLSHDQLVKTVWDDRVVSDEAIRRCVSSLRQALAVDGEQSFIRTVHKKGYIAELPPPSNATTPGAAQVSSTAQEPAPSAPAAVAGRRISRPLTLTLIVVLAAVGLFWLYRTGPEPPLITNIPKESVKEVTVTTPPEGSVAVLPFTNLGSEEQQFFVDGIHDDIITQLARIASLKVISRTSVMQYRDTQKKLKKIGQELGVATIIEGSIQREGDRIRLNAQLLDADTDQIMWAESYDQELTAGNIFAIQSEIAKAIVAATQATLTPEERERISDVPTDNFEAYEAYLLAKQKRAMRTSESVAEAVSLFQRSIELDPAFAPAYAQLANTYERQWSYYGMPRDQMYALAEPVLERALELDPDLGEAYAIRAYLEWPRDIDKAEAAANRAIALAPRSGFVYSTAGAIAEYQGKLETALALWRRAQELEPLSVITEYYIFLSYVNLGRKDEARMQSEKLLRIAPRNIRAYWSKAEYASFADNRLDDAVYWNRKAITEDPKHALSSSMITYALWDLGADESAACVVERTARLLPDHREAHATRMYQALRRGNRMQVQRHARDTLALMGERGMAFYFWRRPNALKLLGDLDLDNGHYIEARMRYAKYFPDLFTADFELTPADFYAAVDIAAALRETGESKQANRLISAVHDYTRSHSRRGELGYWIEDVRAYALQGRTEAALDALQQAVDSGWRDFWWFYVEFDPALESIRDEPRFQAVVEVIKDDVATQRAHVKQMEDFGDTCSNP